MSQGYTVGSELAGRGHYPRSLIARKKSGKNETPRVWAWWLWLIIGVVTAAIGLLPWMLSGMALPPQSLWSPDAASSDLPTALLPLSQYRLESIVELIVVGSALAGIAGRLGHTRSAAGGFRALTGGVVLVQGAATVQSVIVVSGGLRDGVASVAYIAALIVVAVLSIGAGIAVLTLVARAPRAGALIGIALVSYPFALWVAGLAELIPLNQVDLDRAAIVTWPPAVVVGVGIAWCGIGSFGRATAAIIALIALCLEAPLSTAIGAAAGTGLLARFPGDIVDAPVRLLRTVAVIPEAVIPPLGVAVLIAAVGMLLRMAVRHLRRRRIAVRPDVAYS